MLGNGARLWQFRSVSTIADIEAAIERLPAPQVAQLAAWLEEFRQCVPQPVEHANLDNLIGTWQEDERFDAAIRAFEQVDGSRLC